jgi:hypothetical protein
MLAGHDARRLNEIDRPRRARHRGGAEIFSLIDVPNASEQDVGGAFIDAYSAGEPPGRELPRPLKGARVSRSAQRQTAGALPAQEGAGRETCSECERESLDACTMLDGLAALQPDEGRLVRKLIR